MNGGTINRMRKGSDTIFWDKGKRKVDTQFPLECFGYQRLLEGSVQRSVSTTARSSFIFAQNNLDEYHLASSMAPINTTNNRNFINNLTLSHFTHSETVGPEVCQNYQNLGKLFLLFLLKIVCL